jgi:hypothetical protein
MIDEPKIEQKKSGVGGIAMAFAAMLAGCGVIAALWWHAGIDSVAPTITTVKTEAVTQAVNTATVAEEKIAETEMAPEAKPGAATVESLSIDVAALRDELAAVRNSVESIAASQDDSSFYRLQALWRLDARLRQGLEYSHELMAFEKLMQGHLSDELRGLLQLNASTGAVTGVMLREQFTKMLPDIIAVSSDSPKWLSRFVKIRPVSDKSAETEIEKAVISLERLLATESYGQSVIVAEQIKSMLSTYSADKVYGDYIAWLERLKHNAAIWQALGNLQQTLLQEKS